jgi:hypothetical protein
MDLSTTKTANSRAPHDLAIFSPSSSAFFDEGLPSTATMMLVYMRTSLDNPTRWRRSNVFPSSSLAGRAR